jgi:hypothetical protein
MKDLKGRPIGCPSSFLNTFGITVQFTFAFWLPEGEQIISLYCSYLVLPYLQTSTVHNIKFSRHERILPI